MLGAIHPVSTVQWQQDHGVRCRFGQRLLQQSLRGGNGRNDRRVGAHRRLRLVVVSVGQQLASRGADHPTQLRGGGRRAAGGARDCGAARVIHRVAQCCPRSRVLKPTVVRMGVTVVG